MSFFRNFYLKLQEADNHTNDAALVYLVINLSGLVSKKYFIFCFDIPGMRH